MLVSDWMSTRLVSAHAGMEVEEAAQLMQAYQVKHLPVLEEGRLAGIVSDRDIRRCRACETNQDRRMSLDEIMTREVLVAHLHDTIDEAALVMLEHRISSLPVVDEDGRVVAMITQNDLFRALVQLAGVIRGGVLFGLNLADQPGSIKVAADVLRSRGGRVVSILSSRERTAPGRRRVFLRMDGVTSEDLPPLQEELAKVGQVLYIRDATGPQKRLIMPGSGC